MESAPPAPRPPLLAGYLWAFFGTALASMLISPLRTLLELSNVALLYVLAVVVMALRFGRGAAVATALLSSLWFAYVFVPPHFSLAITDAQYLLSAVIMLVVALIVSHLTSMLKQHADFAERKSIESTKLYELAQRLAGAPTPDEVVASANDFLTASFRARQVRVIFPDQFASADIPASPALIRQCAERNEFLSRPLGPGRFYALIPLRAASGTQGVLGFAVESAALATQDTVEHLETVASVLAVALERSNLAERAKATEVRHAAEALRSSILSSLSHDLRTPLTALVGMVDTLALGKLAPERQKPMLEAIRSQALSISQQMTNLLDMAKLNAGKLHLNSAWQPVDEVLGATLQQFRTQWPNRAFRTDVAPGLPPINIDAVLIERVLWNLIENAVKYAPSDSPIDISARLDGPHLALSVCDAGPGLPSHNVEALFNLFQRGNSESDIPGVGLGLSIARTIIEAHGGQISAENREGGGSCFRIALPLGEPPNFGETDGEP